MFNTNFVHLPSLCYHGLTPYPPSSPWFGKILAGQPLHFCQRWQTRFFLEIEQYIVAHHNALTGTSVINDCMKIRVCVRFNPHNTGSRILSAVEQPVLPRGIAFEIFR